MKFFEKATRKSRLRARFTPRLDVLEVREVLSTLTVLNALDSSPGSLRDRVNIAASGDTIVFDPSLNGQTITLTSGTVVDVGKDLTIAGPGAENLTISGGGTSGILGFFKDFSIPSSRVTVSVSGLTLANGKAEFRNGGAIVTYAVDLSVSDTVFVNNTAAGSGGAINADAPFDSNLPPGNTVSITNSRFEGNSAGDYGGAYQSFGSNVTIVGSTFVENSGRFLSGGVLVGAGNLSVSDSLFQGNTSGALTYFGQQSAAGFDLNVTNSTFLDNTGFDGGAAINSNGRATITGSTFENNATTSDFFAEGGAVRTSSSATISSSRFVNNRVDGGILGQGGALFLGGPGANTVTNTEFVGNVASGPNGAGGAVSASYPFFNPNASLTFTGNTFRDNQAIGSAGSAFSPPLATGGALNITESAGPVLIADTTFTNNRATTVDSTAGQGGIARGGAISASGNYAGGPATSLTIRDTTFTSNSARGSHGTTMGGVGEGGAIGSLAGFTSVSISRSTFLANSARSGNGGFAPASGFSGALGGAIQTFGQTIQVDTVAFVGNVALGGDGDPGRSGASASGGAIANARGTVTNSTFAGNFALAGNGGAAVGSGVGGPGGDAAGGAIQTSNLTVNSSTFAGNLASGGKGGSGGTLGTGGSGGKATGGGISFDPGAGSSNVLTVNDSLFTLNLALGGSGGSGAVVGVPGQGLGGAIAILNGSGKINKKTKFVLNRASTSGNNVYGPYTS